MRAALHAAYFQCLLLEALKLTWMLGTIVRLVHRFEAIDMPTDAPLPLVEHSLYFSEVEPFFI